MNEPLGTGAVSPQEKAEIFDRVCRRLSDWHRARARWRTVKRSGLLVIAAALACGGWYWIAGSASPEGGGGHSMVAQAAASATAHQFTASGQRAGDAYWSGKFVTNSRIDAMIAGGVEVEVLTDEQLLATMRELGQPSILATIDGKRVLISDSL